MLCNGRHPLNVCCIISVDPILNVPKYGESKVGGLRRMWRTLYKIRQHSVLIKI